MAGRFAMLIGNSQYDDEMLSSLATPDADVTALAEVLSDPEIGGFDEVTTMLNEMSSVVTRKIARFFSKRRRDDLLIFYFSGHGVVDEHGRLYLGVRDTEHDLLRGTAIPATMITDEMDHSRSRAQTLILDCCHSGAFERGAKGAPGMSIGTATKFQGTGVGRVVLTATDSTQYAWEGDNVVGSAETSVFTKHLINGLKTGSADINGNGVITVDDLYEYVYDHVVAETPKQTPGKWAYKQQGDIEIARNPFAGTVPKPLPDAIEVALVSPLAHVREGGVREVGALLQNADKGLVASARIALERMGSDDSRKVSGLAEELLALNEDAETTPSASVRPPRAAQTKVEVQAAAPSAVVPPPQPAPAVSAAVRQPRSTPVGGQPVMETTALEAKSIARAAVLLFVGWLAYGVMVWNPRLILMLLMIPVVGTAVYLVEAERSWQRAAASAGAMLVAVLVVWYAINGVARVDYWTLNIAQSLNMIPATAIGGLLTGIGLRLVLPDLRVRDMAVISGGWALGGAVYATAFSIAGNYFAELLHGFIGGVAISYGVRRLVSSWSWRSAAILGAAWAVSMFVGVLIFETIVRSNAVSVQATYLISSVFSAATLLCIGGGATLWQIRRTRPSESV